MVADIMTLILYDTLTAAQRSDHFLKSIVHIISTTFVFTF